MNILHICSAYTKQKLYGGLLKYLNAEGLKQTMYVPVRTQEEIGVNEVIQYEHIKTVYSNILKKYHRIFFSSKINCIYNDITSKVDTSNIDLMHAHFLFSDGAVALELFKNKKIPYVVNVRNTDVNLFFKYGIHLRSIGNDIIRNAKKVIFLTPSYLKKVEKDYVISNNKMEFRKKSIILPNGLSSSWFTENIPPRRKIDDYIKLLYVGEFSQNKNVIKIIEATEKLNELGVKIKLTLVGGGGKKSTTTLNKIKNTTDCYVNFIGRVNNEAELMKIYRNHDIFVMPSFRETFGMVYIEAMSQGMPIIYSKSQGIDGYFTNNKLPGKPVNPSSVHEILDTVLEISKNINLYSNNALEASKKFMWSRITEDLVKIYKSSYNGE